MRTSVWWVAFVYFLQIYFFFRDIHIYFYKIINMAAGKSSKGKSSSASIKVNFGKRRLGKAKKSFNKHDKREKNYRGQGK